jgi:hypothetical protein
MPTPAILADFNHARFQPGQAQGHYESYFQRANHPTRPLAFWIRYTVYAPDNAPADAIGELWAVFFNGETGGHVAVKREVPIAQCEFARDLFRARVADAVLGPGTLSGAIVSAEHKLSWELSYAGVQAPLFLLPLEKYEGGFPKAKSVVGQPMARYAGVIEVDGEEHRVDDWIGSQNHNWGSRHTDRYAYGQVCGFDNAPDTFLEMATARLRMGPILTPPMTPLALRHDGREYLINTVWQGLRARASYRYFEWQFATGDAGVRIEGEIRAPKDAFVGLRYYNPPGGEKYCLNSKIASCRLMLRRRGQPDVTLVSHNRAAFEILTDDLAHGVEIRA